MRAKIIALIGKAGSGKDSLAKELVKLNDNTNLIISCTTRPKRDNECEGVDYYFMNNQQFENELMNGQMLEATTFNTWCYGTPLFAIASDKINIGVFNPAGIETLLNFKDYDITVYYLQVSDKQRLIRQLNREKDPDVAEIIRRYHTDDKDFSNLSFEYIPLNNNNYSEFAECLGAISENIV